MEQAIAYYRVSTARQGQSGLGLEAQRAAVEALCKSRGYQLIESYQENESGRHNDRPEIAKAIARCKTSGATLLIARLDRLARNASFVTRLQDEKVKFICADMPDMNETVVGIMAILAQQYSKSVSVATSAAIRARIARGLPWDQGKENLVKSRAWEKSAAAKKKAARQRANGALQHAVDLRTADRSLQQIADRLNETGHRTKHGHIYTPTTVSRLLKMREEA